MNWRAAVRRAWHLPVIWVAEAESQEPEPVTVVHVHYYVPAPGLGAPVRQAITEGNQ